MDPKNLATYLLLVLLAAGSWWIAERLAPLDEKPQARDFGPVDYYSNGLRRTALDETGAPKETLVAKFMAHYKKGDRSEMEKPVMTLFKKGEKPWIVASETGASLAGGETLLLNGAVEIARENERGEKLRILTRDVKYLPDRDYAETAKPVRMFAPQDETSGVGAQIHFEPTLHIKLLADVRRKHEMR
jgi:lipopolysaccharide export system protein LptC